MFKLFIKRPILSGVISVIIVCLGVLSILTLPITQFPDIVTPICNGNRPIHRG